MLPGSAWAATFLLALVPGFLYLRLTAPVRKPSEQTTLQEALEVLTVGLLTTGVTLAVATLIWGHGLYAALDTGTEHTNDLRASVATGVGLLATACVLAGGGAVARARRKNVRRYGPTVWETVFGATMDGHIPHIAFELDDGRTFDGPLHSYTVLPGADGDRQLAIKPPIRATNKGETAPFSTVYDYLVVDASTIKFATVTFVAANAAARRDHPAT